MKSYRANWQIFGHNGDDIQTDDIVKMSDEEAAPLLACGALSVADEDAAKPTTSNQSEE